MVMVVVGLAFPSFSMLILPSLVCYSLSPPSPTLEDISFWPIHPTIERLWVYKKLVGGFTDETWDVTSTSIYGDSCSGHRQDDVIPLEGVLEGGTEGMMMMTNGELYDAMDPTTSTLPYIYDDFTWAHCLEYRDIDFTTLVVGQTLLGDEVIVN